MKRMNFKGLAGILCAAAMAVSFPAATAYANNEADNNSPFTGIVTTIPNQETSVPQTTQTQAESQTILGDAGATREPGETGGLAETEATTTALPYEEPVYDTEEDPQNLLDLLGINQSSTTLDLIMLLTILSLAPSILVLLTCFTRIIISFSLLRNAMGVQQTPPNQAMIGLALFLTLFIMTPVLNEMNDVAYIPYKEGEYTSVEAVKAASAPLKRWMLKNTSNDSMDFFLGLTGTEIAAETEEEFLEEISFVTVVPAFVLSEIKIGFEIGFLIYIPFLIIDIVVSTLLMSMGMMMLPPTTVSVPFKILLFILADGWTLLIGSLVTGFNG